MLKDLAHGPTFGVRDADLLGLAALAAACCAAVLAIPDVTAARIVLGVPFVLLAPGYALICALFGNALPEMPLRLLLALALSLATSIAVALVLNAASISLTSDSFVLALGAVTVACAGAAAIRRARSGLPPAPAVRQPGTLRWALSILVAALVFAGLVGALREPLPNRHVAGYSQLSALRAGPSLVSVRVKSAEQESTRYRVEALASGRRLRSVTLTLQPGQEWKGLVRTGGPRIPIVEVSLYRLSNPKAVYRRVVLRP